MLDLAEIQPELLIKQNSDMLQNCVFFEAGGNYAVEEVAWYRGQMDDIDKLLTESKLKRKEAMATVETDIERLKKDPSAEFKGAYSSQIQQLSAKEGLGKTFGQPRRLAQERLRAEMTKCEQAQRGVDQLLDKLEKLCYTALQDDLTAKHAIQPPTTKGIAGKKAVIQKSVSI